MPRALAAPDKFEGSLSAAEVAEAVIRGLTSEVPGLECGCCPWPTAVTADAAELPERVSAELARRRLSSP